MSYYAEPSSDVLMNVKRKLPSKGFPDLEQHEGLGLTDTPTDAIQISVAVIRATAHANLLACAA